MKKRIAHIVSSPATSGVTAMIRLLAMEMDPKEYDHHLIHYGLQEGVALDFISMRLPVHRISTPGFWAGPLRTRWIITRLRELLKTINPDIIHAHSFDADLVAARANSAVKKPMAVTCQSFSYVDWVKNKPRQYERWGNRINLFVPVCKMLSDRILELSTLRNASTRVIFNVPDRRFFMPLSQGERVASRARFGLTDDIILIACVANFYPIKGQDILVSAFKRLNRRERQRLCLMLAGSAGEDPERQMYQQNVKAALKAELSVGQAIVVDPCRDAREVLAAADIYVQPSFTEALSVALGEAMACGMPIVATSVGGNPEIISDKKTGILIPAGDADAISQEISNLIDNPSYMKKIGQAAAAFAREKLSPDSISIAYEDLYRDLLGKNKGDRASSSVSANRLTCITSIDQ